MQKITEIELHHLERLNRQGFGVDDEYSQPGAIAKHIKQGGEFGLLYDSRNADALAYWLATRGRLPYLLRYAVADAHHGRGLARRILADFWSNFKVARTYVADTSGSSLHALLRSGFLMHSINRKGFIELVGVREDVQP